MSIKKVSKTVKSDTPVATRIKAGDDCPLWLEFRELELMAFGLPDQNVKDHAKFISPSGKNQMIISLKSSAILPLLEDTFVKKYSFEQSEKYVIVTKL